MRPCLFALRVNNSLSALSDRIDTFQRLSTLFFFLYRFCDSEDKEPVTDLNNQQFVKRNARGTLFRL
jgi:hypothetical protein